MKKYIIPLILFIILLAFMSTGSLAIYTQQREMLGRLYTRVFLFNAKERSTGFSLGESVLSLAPGEGERELYRFELSNANSSSEVSDYNIQAAITSSGMANALSAMDGLVFRLYDVTSENNIPIATVSSGDLSKDGIVFRAGIRQTIQYKLCAEWVDTGDSAAQTAVASSGKRYAIGLRITATGMD